MPTKGPNMISLFWFSAVKMQQSKGFAKILLAKSLQHVPHLWLD